MWAEGMLKTFVNFILGRHLFDSYRSLYATREGISSGGFHSILYSLCIFGRSAHLLFVITRTS